MAYNRNSMQYCGIWGVDIEFNFDMINFDTTKKMSWMVRENLDFANMTNGMLDGSRIQSDGCDQQNLGLRSTACNTLWVNPP